MLATFHEEVKKMEKKSLKNESRLTFIPDSGFISTQKYMYESCSDFAIIYKIRRVNVAVSLMDGGETEERNSCKVTVVVKVTVIVTWIVVVVVTVAGVVLVLEEYGAHTEGTLLLDSFIPLSTQPLIIMPPTSHHLHPHKVT